jgi:hypothetical protein
MPVYGEASNHSSVSIEEPDYSRYTRARYMKEYSERVILNCGDALFIPEGWYVFVLFLGYFVAELFLFQLSFGNSSSWILSILY